MNISIRRYGARLAMLALMGALGCTQELPEGRGGVALDGTSALTTVNITAPMVSQHVRGAATRLADGRVLVSGGWSPASNLIDVFDPVAGTWVAGPSSVSTHVDHSAFTLGGGRVTLAGGTAESVEVLDPLTGTWTNYPDAYRQYAAAAPLADGRVLVTGGYGVGAEVAQSAILDPSAGTLQPSGSLLTPRDCHRAVLLADGRVLVLGGRNGSGTYLASAELYDPQSGTFSAASPMSTARLTPAATRLLDGRVLVTGGGNGNALASAEVYDPATNAWTPVGTMLHARQLHEAILLPDGRVAVLGGTGVSSATTADVEVFDPATGAFTLAGALSVPRYYESSVVLTTGQLLVASGLVPGSSGLTTAELVSFGECAPATCASVGKDCGVISDGCGGTLECGSCADGMTCESNVCVGGCIPATCASLGAACGQVADGCGALLSCGECGPGTTCDAANACVPLPQSAAVFDPAYGAPRCANLANSCDSGALLMGRANAGPEVNQPNTIDGCADGPSGTFHGDESLDALRVITVDGSTAAAGATIRIEADVWAYAGYSSDALDLFIAADASNPVWTKVTTIVPSAAGAQTLSTTTTLPRGGTVQGVRGLFRYGTGTSACVAGSYNDHDDLLFAVEQPPDTVPPTVTLTSPTAAYIAGSVALQASASDDVGVVRVAFLDGGTVVANAFSPPWLVSWNTTLMANGSRTLTAVAYDAAGNTASSSRTVFIDNAKPAAQIVSPAPGASVSGTVTISADVSDNVGVASLAFYDGATLIGIRYGAPWSVSWSTANAGAGSHTLTARAYDPVGNVGVSPAVVVSVSGGTAPGNAVYDSIRRAPVCASADSYCDSGTLLNGRAALGPELNASNSLGGTCNDGTSGTYHSDESLDRLKISTLDGSPLAAGKTVRIEATVWVWGAASDRLDLYAAANADAPMWTLIGTLAPTASGLQTLGTTYVLPAAGLRAIRGMFRYGGTPGSCVLGAYNDVDDLAFLVQ